MTTQQTDTVLLGEVKRGGAPAGIQFKSAEAARFFCKELFKCPPQARRWTDERWLEVGAKWSAHFLAQQRKPWQTPALDVAARVMRDFRRKNGKAGATFRGVRCDCCGTLLTAPESVLAGRGPKCMEDGARPLAALPTPETEK